MTNLPHYNKFSSRGGAKITRIIVHHWAGVAGGDARLANPQAQVSANYIIYSDGRLVAQVPEKYRAWTSGSAAADAKSITVEIQNSGGAPDWKISAKAEATLIRLAVQLARKYKWGPITSDRIIGHRDVAATACPGDYLYNRLGSIRSKVNAQLQGKTSTGTKPKNTELLNDKETEKMYAVYYLEKKTYHVMIISGAGLAAEYTTSTAAYNNRLAKALGSFMEVSKSHYQQLKKDLQKVRTGAS